jgi:phosphatidylglycerophosphate synthase
MIGVVLCSDFGERVLLGLPLALRAALSLQSAGVERILVLSDTEPSWLSDERLRLPVERASSWPAGGAIVVCDGVACDPAALRALAAHEGEVRVRQGLELVLARTDRGGSLEGFAGAARGPAVLPRGVAMLARTQLEASIAENALLRSLRKPQDGWVSRTINRRISLSITRRLANTSLRPNQLSAAILVVGVLSGVLAALGGPVGLVVGALLFQLQSVLDGCDGELSRVTFRGSRAGQWLDTIGDDATNYAFFTGASLGLRALGAPAWLWIAGLVGVAIGLVASAIEYRYLVSIGSGDLLAYPLGFGEADADGPNSDPTLVQRVLGAFRPLFKRDFFAFATMVAALAGPAALSVALVLFALGAAATLSAVIASELRRARRPRDER